MKLDELKTNRVFDKIYSFIRVDVFIELLSQLTSSLTTYILSYKSLRFLESRSNSKYDNLKAKIDYAKNEIINISKKIDEFFNEGFFQELSKEQADSISDEYQELIEIVIVCNNTIRNTTYQQFTDLISTYNDIIKPMLKDLNRNIDIYNKKAYENSWKYKLRSYEDAINYFNRNYDNINKNFL